MIMPYVEQGDLNKISNVSFSYYNVARMPDNVIRDGKVVSSF